MNVAVIGAGYVGAVTAAGLAAWGHSVKIYDLNDQRARALVAGAPDIVEPGLVDLVDRSEGRLRAALSLPEALEGTRIALVCVGTPSDATGRIDLRSVRRSVSEVLLHVSAASLVVCIRSTVTPGTTDELDRQLLAPKRAQGFDVTAAANPEFLREGRAVRDFMEPDRVVFGSSSDEAIGVLRVLYGPAAKKVIVMSAASAELAKYANNALLATLVSFSNELAEYAEEVPNCDVVDALASVHADRRWREAEGPWSPSILNYLWPGCGYGGSCLPKDVKALVTAASERGLDPALVRATDTVNERQARRLVDRIARVSPLDGRKVAVLGTAFKEYTADQRSSPGLAIAELLRQRGATVATYDPMIRDTHSVDDLEGAVRGASVWVVVTGAQEFDGLTERAVAAGALFVDARRRFRPTRSGYFGPGREV